jgi:adenylate cyclase
VLNRIFSAFDALSERYRVEKIKTIGDAYMVAAGLPDPRPDHAAIALDLAFEMLDALERIRLETHLDLALRIGVHTGPVVAGVIGKRKFSYDLWGDTVNTASRMESHGQPGKIQITDATRRLVEDSFDLVPRGEITVKGKGLMETYFVLGRKGAYARRAAGG